MQLKKKKKCIFHLVVVGSAVCYRISAPARVSTHIEVNKWGRGESGGRGHVNCQVAVRLCKGRAKAGAARTPRSVSWKKNMRHNQSALILCSGMIFQYPLSVRGTWPLTPVHLFKVKKLGKKRREKSLNTYEKKTMFILQEGHVFCTNCKLNTVIIQRVIIFDITFMNEHQNHVNK